MYIYFHFNLVRKPRRSRLMLQVKASYVILTKFWEMNSIKEICKTLIKSRMKRIYIEIPQADFWQRNFKPNLKQKSKLAIQKELWTAI